MALSWVPLLVTVAIANTFVEVRRLMWSLCPRVRSKSSKANLLDMPTQRPAVRGEPDISVVIAGHHFSQMTRITLTSLRSRLAVWTIAHRLSPKLCCGRHRRQRGIWWIRT